MKIITIIGARPQFVKAAVVSKALQQFPSVEEKILHTGQHFDADMSAVFFEELDLPRPHFNLNINGLSHGAMTGRMLEAIESILLSERPDRVLVYGDTNSTLAGALAARKLLIPVAHVEAGIRSGNPAMAEEINRILTDRMSDLLFCPTDTAVDNLRAEGFEQFNCKFLHTGDVMEDAALTFAQQAPQNSSLRKKLQLEEQDFVLCTLHRAENTDNPERLNAIVEALNEIARHIPLVLPLHPRTAAILKKTGLSLQARFLPPVGYLDMLQLLQQCRMVITDSGGLQKEAYFFDKFCLTLRDDTEWPELVTLGANYLVGANRELIIETFWQVLDTQFPKKKDFFGRGTAAARIANILANNH